MKVKCFLSYRSGCLFYLLDKYPKVHLELSSTAHFQACSDPKSRPAFLSEKALEPALKVILRKFPNVENTSKVSNYKVFLAFLFIDFKELSSHLFFELFVVELF